MEIYVCKQLAANIAKRDAFAIFGTVAQNNRPYKLQSCIILNMASYEAK